MLKYHKEFSESCWKHKAFGQSHLTLWRFSSKTSKYETAFLSTFHAWHFNIICSDTFPGGNNSSGNMPMLFKDV